MLTSGFVEEPVLTSRRQSGYVLEVSPRKQDRDLSHIKVSIHPTTSTSDPTDEGGGPLAGRFHLLRAFTADVDDPSLPYGVTMALRARAGRLSCSSITLAEQPPDGPAISAGRLRAVTIDGYVNRVYEELIRTAAENKLIWEVRTVEGSASVSMAVTATARGRAHDATVKLSEEADEARPKIVLLQESAPGAPPLRRDAVIKPEGIKSEASVGTPTVTGGLSDDEIHHVFDSDSATATDDVTVTKITAEVAAELYRDALARNSKRPTAEVAERLDISRGYASKLLGQARKEGLLGPATKGQAGEAAAPHLDLDALIEETQKIAAGADVSPDIVDFLAHKLWKRSVVVERDRRAGDLSGMSERSAQAKQGQATGEMVAEIKAEVERVGMEKLLAEYEAYQIARSKEMAEMLRNFGGISSPALDRVRNQISVNVAQIAQDQNITSTLMPGVTEALRRVNYQAGPGAAEALWPVLDRINQLGNEALANVNAQLSDSIQKMFSQPGLAAILAQLEAAKTAEEEEEGQLELDVDTADEPDGEEKE